MHDTIPTALTRRMIRLVDQTARLDAARHIAVGLANHRGILPPGEGPDLMDALLAGMEPDVIPASTLCDIVAGFDDESADWLLGNVYGDAYMEVAFDLITTLEATR